MLQYCYDMEQVVGVPEFKSLTIDIDDSVKGIFSLEGISALPVYLDVNHLDPFVHLGTT